MFRHTGAYVAVLIVLLLTMVASQAELPSAGMEDAAVVDGASPPAATSEDLTCSSGEDEAPEEIPTFTVEPTRLKIEVSLDGVFEAESMFPVSIVPEVWSDLKVLRAVSAGTAVREGSQILWLDTEDIDRQLEELKAGEALADLQLQQAEHELAFLDRSTERDLDWAIRAGRIAQENYDRWADLTEGYRDQYLALDDRAIHLRHRSSIEELAQLEEMYAADELIEDTETIILERNRYYAARAEVDYVVQQGEHNYNVILNVPRDRQQHARDLENSRIALEQAEIMLPLRLAIKREQVAKAGRDRDRARENLRDLQADRELLTVRAPADGVVYYGECVRGQWVSGGAMEVKLREGGRVGPREVFMTIVQPEALIVRATIAEGNLYEITPRRRVTVTPTGYPDDRISGRVTDVLVAPSLAAKYSILVSLNIMDPSPILPGMTCSLKVLVVDRPDALMVPASAVHSEEDEPDERYVYMHVPDGEPERRSVEVGRTKGEDIEILEGLVAGEVILLEDPSQDDSADQETVEVEAGE